MNEGVYQRAVTNPKGEPALSMQLNVNREILHANRCLIHTISLWQWILRSQDETANNQ